MYEGNVVFLFSTHLQIINSAFGFFFIKHNVQELDTGENSYTYEGALP